MTKKSGITMQQTARIRMAYTGIMTDDRVGSAAERNYYRVIPAGSTEKLFFKDREEYGKWRLREYYYCCYGDEERHVDEEEVVDPYTGFWPVALIAG